MESYVEQDKLRTTSPRLIALFGAISSVTTFRGVQEYGLSGGDDLFNAYVGPFLLTLASVTIGIFGWNYAIAQFIQARTPQDKMRVYFAIGFVSLMLISTSTGFSIIGLSGDRCLNKSYRTSLMAAEKAHDELVGIRKMEKGLITPLELGAGQAKVLAKSEVRGAVSGRGGNRKIAANIRGLQHGYEDLAKKLKNSVQKHEMTASQGQLIFQEIRSTIYDDSIGAEEKGAILAPLFSDLNLLLTDLRISAVPAVLGFVQNIDEVYLSKAAYMDSARDAIQEPIDNSKLEIMKQVKLIRKQKEPDAPCVRIVVGFSEGDEGPRIVHLFSFFPTGPKGLMGAPAGAILSHMDVQCNQGGKTGKQDGVSGKIQGRDIEQDERSIQTHSERLVA